jgi:hypothetical protein
VFASIEFLAVAAFGAFAAYESGELVRWGPISSGASETTTPAGLYHLNWRATGPMSTVNPHWFLPWYFNDDNEGGRAFRALWYWWWARTTSPRHRRGNH